MFKDPRRQQHFAEQGFVRLPFLDPAAVSRLQDWLQASPPVVSSPIGFDVSLDSPQPGYAGRAMEALIAATAEAAALHFGDVQVFTASFVIKAPGPRGLVPPHQDWTFVDESAAASATVWVPLVDTDFANGTMGVIPGSHRLPGRRASPSPFFPAPIARHSLRLLPWAQFIPLRAGEALVFDNRLVHCSPPNLSAAPRLAGGIGIAPAEAPLLHYYALPGRTDGALAEYAIDRGFFTRYNNERLARLHAAGGRPEDLDLRREVPADLPLEWDALAARLEAAGNRPDPLLARRFADLGFGNPG
jgi:hypothetical protein